MAELLVRRVMTPAEARALRGEWVPALAPEVPLTPVPTVEEPTLIRDADTGELLAMSTLLDPEWRASLRAAILSINSWGNIARTGDRMGRSGGNGRTFGWAPRRVMTARESCRAAMLADDQPDVHRVLAGLGVELSAQFRQLHPERAAADSAELAGQVADEWRIGDDALWTSGVINKVLQLPYHYDAQNFDTWSAMPTLRRGIEGGRLHLPEYNFAFTCGDGEVAWFCGRRRLHGVTPMQERPRLGKPGNRGVGADYRYSIVFYALRGMKDCATHALETAEGLRRRTERERDMARRIREGENRG